MIGIKSKVKRFRVRRQLTSAKLIFLHMPKTAGTTIRATVNSLRNNGVETGVWHAHHRWSVKDIIKTGTKADIGFVIRSPEERFVSAFYERLRLSGPTYNIPWSVREAITFTNFSHANDLAEALYCGDVRLESAAKFSMESLTHFKRGYRYYFGDVAGVEKFKHRLKYVWHMEDVAKNLRQVLSEYGATEEEIEAAFTIRHIAPSRPPHLSDVGLKNLSRLWKQEYQIFDALTKLAQAE